MKIRISNYGELWIKRAVHWKQQECPYGKSEDIYCGDWCPLFGEPEHGVEVMSSTKHSTFKQIQLCEKSLRCKPEEFEDDR